MPKSKHPRKAKGRKSPRGVADWSGPAAKHGPFGIFSNVRLFYIVGALIMVGSVLTGGLAVCVRGSTTVRVTPTPEATELATPSVTETPAPQVKQYATAPPMTIDTAKTYTATIRTDKGDIQVELFAKDAPNTVNNFVFLAREGFYDELPFYYVNTDLYAITGDPAGNGKGGPGYNIDREASAKTFEVGTLGMGMISGSQFFILLNPSQVDTGNYWPFGKVTAGLDVVQGLVESDQVLGIDIVEQ